MTELKYDHRGHHRARYVGRAVAVLALVVLAVSSCGRLQISGPRPANQKPELILVNVPAGGQLFGFNPIVYWYGTDIDGRVVRYDYAVVPESTVKLFIQRHNNCSQGSSDADKFIRCGIDSMPWVSIFVDSAGSTLPTQQKMPLFASFDTLDCDSQIVSRNVIGPDGNVDSVIFVTIPVNCISVAVPQYMFIRAIDDQGLQSDIKYRSFLRDNHWPETNISPTFLPYEVKFSIPQLTETYSGIEVRWGGNDRGDFLTGQPPLSYHWRVYGPYPVGQGRPEDRPTLADTILFSAPSQESHNPDPKQGVWVMDTVTSVYDLWRGVDQTSGPVDTTRDAFFLFVVQSRDDASISDPSPAWTTFEAVYPKFERKLLLVDETAYGITPGGYPSWDPNRTGNAAAQSSDTNRAFLFRMAHLIDATANAPHDPWTIERDFWERLDQQVFCKTDRCSPAVPVTELSRHELVLYIDDDFVQPLTKDPDVTVPLSQYLNIGGKVWLISRCGLLLGTEMGPTAMPKMVNFLINKRMFAPSYFGIDQLYFAGFQGVVSRTPPPPGSSNDEFIAAKAIESSDPSLQTPANLPAMIDVDTSRVSVHYLGLRQFVKLDTIRGVEAVGYVTRWTGDARAPATRPLYLFQSWRPGLSPADQRLVAIRAVGPSLQTPKYKTAFMGSPLWFFEESQDQVDKYVTGMADWFYNHPIEEGP